MGSMPEQKQEQNPQRPHEQTQKEKDFEQAHQIYLASKKLLYGRYDAEFLDMADSEEERRFYSAVSDVFLQQKQRELIAAGVF
jgi:hypothetical protein